MLHTGVKQCVHGPEVDTGEVTPMPITDMRTILINQRGIASVSFQETDPD